MRAEIPQYGKLNRCQRNLLAEQKAFVDVFVDDQPVDVVLYRFRLRRILCTLLQSPRRSVLICSRCSILQSARCSTLGRVVAHVPAQLGFDSRDQLQRVKRLGDVIVSTDGQSQDLIRILRLGGQHDHREKVVLPDAAADLKSVHVREHDIENGQIRRLLLDSRQRRSPVAKNLDRIAVVLQIHRDQIRNFLFIIHNVNRLVHDIPHPSICTASIIQRWWDCNAGRRGEAS